MTRYQPRSILKPIMSVAATALLLGPLLATAADAGGGKSRKASKNTGQMMRLGGPTNGATASRGPGSYSVDPLTGAERRNGCYFCNGGSRNYFLDQDRTRGI